MTDPLDSQVTIVLADDDEDDRLMTREALAANRLTNPLHEVSDGVELLDYLNELVATGQDLPGLILLDLNMPRMDGREALSAIKSSAELRQIPVVVLTTSRAEEDIFRTYDLGVNSFVTKPVTFTGLVDVMHELGHYWLQMVQLPPSTPRQ